MVFPGLAWAQTGIVSFSQSSYTVNVSQATAVIPVTFTGSTNGTGAVSFATHDGTATAGVAYVAVSTPLSFPVGVLTTNVSITILNNGISQSTQTVNLALSGVGGFATLGSPSNAVLAIINDAVQSVKFDQATYSVDDTDTEAVVTLDRIGGTNGTISVDLSTSDGSARAGINYTATNETVTFLEGVLTNTASIAILPPSGLNTNQTVKLALTNPSEGASLGSPNKAVLTIVATGPPVIGLSAASYSVHEHVGRCTITAFRFGSASGQATADYATSDGTAISGVDYFGTSGTLVFPPGASRQSFTFQFQKFSTFQSNKTVNVTLSNPGGGASLTQDTAVVTIVNDRPQTITFTNSGGGVVTLRLQFAGTMEVTNQEPLDLLLSATDPTSVLTIKAKKSKMGIGSLEIDQITGDGGCRSIDARNFDVTGPGIQLGDYLKKLRIHDLLSNAVVTANGAITQDTTIQAHNIDSDGTISVGSRISNLKAARFGHDATINAPRIGAMSIRGDKRNQVPGDCDGVIIISGDGLAVDQKALGQLSVSGTISNAIIEIDNGSVGSVTALKMIDSTLLVGFTPDDPGAPLAGGTFTADMQIGSVNIRSSLDGFVNSNIAASKVGNIHLFSVATDNGGLPFGVIARQHISAVSVKLPPFKWVPNESTDQTLGDFHVILMPSSP